MLIYLGWNREDGDVGKNIEKIKFKEIINQDFLEYIIQIRYLENFGYEFIIRDIF